MDKTNRNAHYDAIEENAWYIVKFTEYIKEHVKDFDINKCSVVGFNTLAEDVIRWLDGIDWDDYEDLSNEQMLYRAAKVVWMHVKEHDAGDGDFNKFLSDLACDADARLWLGIWLEGITSVPVPTDKQEALCKEFDDLLVRMEYEGLKITFSANDDSLRAFNARGRIFGIAADEEGFDIYHEAGRKLRGDSIFFHIFDDSDDVILA